MSESPTGLGKLPPFRIPGSLAGALIKHLATPGPALPKLQFLDFPDLSGAPYTLRLQTLTECLLNIKERAVDLDPSPTSGTSKYFGLQSPISKMEVLQAPHWL